MEFKENTRNRFDSESGDISKKMEKENNSLINELSKTLKGIKKKSLHMKSELENSNKNVEEIGSVFNNSLKIISETMGQLKVVLQTNLGIYCYLLFFVIAIIIFVLFYTFFS